MWSEGKTVSNLNDPLFVEYWRLQYQLNDLYEKYCLNCRNYALCWHLEGCCYYPENIYEFCRRDEIKRIILRKEQIVKKRGDILYFAANIDEIAELERKFNVKSKPPKYVDEAPLDFGITAVAGRVINPKDLSLWQKIKAILGINDNVGFCSKHKLYFRQESITAQINQNIIYVCPQCLRSLKRNG